MAENDQWRQECRAVGDQAKAALRLSDVWDLAPYHHEPAPVGDGSYWSPFRDKGDSKNFSISNGCTVFVDFARAAPGVKGGCKGGVYEFIQLACPTMEPKEIYALMVDRAGLKYPARPDGAKAGKSAAELREQRLQRQMRRKEERERYFRDLKKSRSLPPKGIGMPRMPEFIQERWESGLGVSLSVVEKLCKKRGWPIEWAELLQYEGKISFPVLPWQEPHWKTAKRFIAFLVEEPECTPEGWRLKPAGYHQKFFYPSTQQKGWVFMPYAPREIAGRVGLLRKCADWVVESGFGEYRDGKWQGGRPVQPVPFVIGEIADPRCVDLVVITEGQWDCLTVAGAMGHFSIDGHSSGLRVVYFGVRGAENYISFLSFWQDWMRAYGGPVWMIADKDVAGRSWFERKHDPQRPSPACFLELLGRLGCTVSAQRLSDGASGKDFNDWFTERQPGIDQMIELLKATGLGVVK